MSEEHEPRASWTTARCPLPIAPPEAKPPVPLRLPVAVLWKAAVGWSPPPPPLLRVADENARTDRLKLALTSNAYHTAVVEQGVMVPPDPVDRPCGFVRLTPVDEKQRLMLGGAKR